MNHLAQASSPYLLQHAENPVDWYPWGAEALAKARAEDKPILLSIGYSACHWCHVMAHESFENLQVAELMNKLFINIKVDREERPDLDKIYQTAHQLLARQSGGWPLTVFLEPIQHMPFFSGTYFPPQERYGLPAFTDLLQNIAQYYHKHRLDIQQQNVRLDLAFKALAELPKSTDAMLTDAPIKQGIQHLIENFDPQHGGFYTAPKFPHPTALTLLLNTSQENGLDVAKLTLMAMAKGGIYDHIGGGFFRYAVDDAWQIPHFEKMLYDNALLLHSYVDAMQRWNEDLFEQAAIETCEWVMREMQAMHGGYYASLDADAEGKEGKFYAWDKEAVKALLGEQEFHIFAAYYGLNQPANFEGQWHLHIEKSIERLTQEFNLSKAQVQGSLSEARQKLFIAREQRVHPGRDNKVLTAWNSLMIKAMVKAGFYLRREDFITSAMQALNFIIDNLWRDGYLHVTYHEGQIYHRAYLDDYALLLDAILTVLQIQWDTRLFQFSQQLADILLTEFFDSDIGGFYFTSHLHETLIARPKPLVDEALPAGNGIAIQALLQLSHFTGEHRYLQAAEKTLHAIWETIKHSPAGHYCVLNALAEFLKPSEVIIIHGDPQAIKEWQADCLKKFNPHRLVFAIPEGAAELPTLLQKPQGITDTCAILCQGTACSAPILELAELKSHLASNYP